MRIDDLNSKTFREILADDTYRQILTESVETKRSLARRKFDEYAENPHSAVRTTKAVKTIDKVSLRSTPNTRRESIQSIITEDELLQLANSALSIDGVNVVNKATSLEQLASLETSKSLNTYINGVLNGQPDLQKLAVPTLLIFLTDNTWRNNFIDALAYQPSGVEDRLAKVLSANTTRNPLGTESELAIAIRASINNSDDPRFVSYINANVDAADQIPTT